MSESVAILLIEDNPGDARLVQEYLRERSGLGAEVCETLRRGLQHLREHEIDVVLVDLGLPDSQGIETFMRVFTEAPCCPIIVLTGNDDDEIALQALRAGAQDYLVKSEINGELLVRAVRYSIERQKLLQELEEARHAEAEEHERGALARIGGPGTTSVSARMYGMRPVQEAAPDLFAELAERYAAVLEHALEKKVLKIDAPTGPPLKKMAEQLGMVVAGPRDVVEIHRQALELKCSREKPLKARAYAAEGRLLVLELMGYLASFYRTYYPGRGMPHRHEEDRHGS